VDSDADADVDDDSGSELEVALAACDMALERRAREPRASDASDCSSCECCGTHAVRRSEISATVFNNVFMLQKSQKQNKTGTFD
jgi:hypothetical protein